MSDRENKDIPREIEQRTLRSQSSTEDQYYRLNQSNKPELLPNQTEEPEGSIVESDSEFEETISDDPTALLTIKERQIKNLEIKVNLAKTESAQNLKIIEEQQLRLEALHADNLQLNDQIFQNNRQQLNRMAVELKDAILAIPSFSGDKKDLDTFLNTCDLYVELIAAAHMPNLLRIIKSKITGEALSKIAPIADLTTWPLMKTRLKQRIIKKVSFEFAQEDINNLIQNKSETIDQYGTKAKAKLKTLNESLSEITENDQELTILRRVNEKLAISKFQQNLRDNDIRILVSAASKTSLDECISYALQKELLQKTKNKPTCTICGMNNHEESTCRRRKDQNNDNNKPKSNKNTQKFYYKNQSNTNNGNNQSKEPSTSGSTTTQNKNENNNFKTNEKQYENRNHYYNKNSNGNSNRNVKAMKNEDEDNDITVKEILESDDEDSSYQINKLNSSIENSIQTTTIDLFIKNDEIFVELPTTISNQNLVFCIDTGAQISVIKPQKILDAKINIKRKINISGVAKNAKLQSLGLVSTRLNCNDLHIAHNFHVLNKNFNIMSDGIIGNDFLIKTNARIDFASKTIFLKKPNKQFMFGNSGNDIQLEKEKFISKFKIQLSDENQKNFSEFNEDEYFNAIHDYMQYETKIINMIKTKKKKKIKNKHFYTEMPDDFFEHSNYEEIIPEQFETNSIDSEFSLTGSINSKNITNTTVNSMSINNENSNSHKRAEKILSKINTRDLTESQINELFGIFLEYGDAFYIEGDTLQTTDVYEHSIKLKPDVDTVFIRQYRVPETQKNEIRQQVKQLLDKNIIEKSTSKFNSPLLLVKKRSDDPNKPEYRLVVDYRKLNESTIPQLYPMPLIDEIADKLYESEIFTVLDVFSAFHQIRLKEECRHLTAFSTSTDHFQFKCVPFGLQSSPIAWLYTINRVLRDINHRNIFWYMDDLILYEGNEKKNLSLIKITLKQLIKHKLRLKPEKCKFLQKSVKFLGYKISNNGLEIDESKISCVKNYPRPTNVKEVMRFCGFANFYRKWICNFAKIARPLYNLLKKNTIFIWNNNCESAFRTLITALITPPVLAFPRFDLDFILSTDASQISCSGILANKDNRDERPIQYFSRSLNEAQARYSTIELELLAIIWSIEHFRSYLYGRKFFIFTDHKPLIYLFGNNNMSARLHRWRLTLMEYQFEVIHRDGKSNYGPDALSRIKLNNEENSNEKSIFKVTTRSHQNQNKTLNEDINNNITIPNVINDNSNDRNSFYYIEEKNRILLNKNEYDHIFFIFHKINCRMQKYVQHKLKKIIKIKDLKYGELLSMDDNRSIVLISNLLRDQVNIENTENSIKTIIAYANTNNYENIALNVDFIDARSYFQFKFLLRKFFASTNIKITLHLNKTIELNDINDINKVLKNFHDTLLGGHAGFERMNNLIRRFYVWHNMSLDIRNYIKRCQICQRNKITKHTKQPLIITSISLTCFESIFIDHVGKINPVVDGFAYILTIICDLSKFVIAIPVVDTTAETTAKNLVENVFLKYGFPSRITSDNFKSFTGDTLKQITKILKIKQIFTSPYTPSSNVVERFHKTLNGYLRAFISKNPNRWPDIIQYATFAHNNLKHTSTNYTPFQLVYGRTISLPRSLLEGNLPAYTYDNYADELKHNMRMSWSIARENLIKRKEHNKTYYDSHNKTENLELNIGDSVYMLKQNRNHKFDEIYEGPYNVIEITGRNSVKIKKNNKIIRTHKNKLKKATEDISEYDI